METQNVKNGSYTPAVKQSSVPTLRNDSAAMQEFAYTQHLAQTFIESGLFSDTRNVAQATVKIMAGKELGLTPFVSMRDLSIIQGKIAMAAAQISARMEGAGASWEVLKFDATGAVIRFWKGGKQCKPDISFSAEDAKRMGLIGKDNYTKQARTMLFWRAMTMGARMFFPHVFNGAIYTPDELGGSVPLEDIPTGTPEVTITAEVQPETEAPELPEPSDDPWSWRLQGTDSYRGNYRTKRLFEVPTASLEKLMKAAYENMITPDDRANIMTALLDPEGRKLAIDAVVNASQNVSLEEDEIPDYNGREDA